MYAFALLSVPSLLPTSCSIGIIALGIRERLLVTNIILLRGWREEHLDHWLLSRTPALPSTLTLLSMSSDCPSCSAS